MKKKVLSLVLVAAMSASMVACGSNGAATNDANTQATTPETQAATPETQAANTEAADFDYGSGSITIWVADNVVDFTKTQAEQFIADKGVDYTITVEPVGEGDAAGNVITDVEGAADIYGFAQDQTARLVSANALQQITGTGFDEWIAAENDAGAVGAATVGDNIYAFPLTSDNGYFLYYDKSVVTDPTSLEKILADCEAAGKSFYFDLGAWYNVAFFFGTGCTATYETDNDGNFISTDIDYATNEKAVVALKEIVDMVSSSAYQQGSAVDAADASKLAAIVDGTWDAASAQKVFGDNYACAELPSFEGSDGSTYHMAGFSGNKLIGVKPQTEAGKLKLCLELAQYLTSADVQTARFEEVGWGPSNLTAQASDAVQADPALSALAAQMPYCIPQGQYPQGYWDAGTALIDDAKGLVGASDEDLKAYLEKYVATCTADIQ